MMILMTGIESPRRIDVSAMPQKYVLATARVVCVGGEWWAKSKNGKIYYSILRGKIWQPRNLFDGHRYCDLYIEALKQLGVLSEQQAEEITELGAANLAAAEVEKDIGEIMYHAKKLSSGQLEAVVERLKDVVAK